MVKKKPHSQKTPKGHEIPIPTKDDFFRDLEKATEPDEEKEKSNPARRPKKMRDKK